MTPYYIVRTCVRNIIDDRIAKYEICGLRNLGKHKIKDTIFCAIILDSGFKDVEIHREVCQYIDCHHDKISGRHWFNESLNTCE